MAQLDRKTHAVTEDEVARSFGPNEREASRHFETQLFRGAHALVVVPDEESRPPEQD